MHQLAVAMYMKAVGDLNVTPVQFSALHTTYTNPSIDQKTLAFQIGYDVATVAGVLSRLEARGLVCRAVAPYDRRARLLSVTGRGAELVETIVPRVLKSQEQFLQPLNEMERFTFSRLSGLLLSADSGQHYHE